MDELNILGRKMSLFTKDMLAHEAHLKNAVTDGKFLVIGGAGSIGQAVVKEIFKRHPKKLHVVDISENNLVELVRDLRSSFGYISGEFRTYALDLSSLEYDAYFSKAGDFDYVLNLAALKHVRSEKDPFTLMRMIEVNVLGIEKTLQQSIEKGVKKYFCVSTDKAANPVNMMGASKRIMEKFLVRQSKNIEVSMARFANVAFSDGSLLHGFTQRMRKQQPLVAPDDVKRYFMTPTEAGELCLLSCIYGRSADIFFPSPSCELQLKTFSDLAMRYLVYLGYDPYQCEDEEHARLMAKNIKSGDKRWPCLFTPSDTTGEKDVEEFFTTEEDIDLSSFHTVGIIKNDMIYDDLKLDLFKEKLIKLKQNLNWDKEILVQLFNDLLPNFEHDEKQRYLDSKM